MASKKKPIAITETAGSSRPYTGFDGNARAALPGTIALRDLILFLNPKLTNLGTYAKRDARGKPGQPSVHATGRATDIGYTDRSDIQPVITWLTDNADLLGVEMVADYYPKPWGMSWRCDRHAWKVYDRRTIHGAPGGRWIHLEVAPHLANNAAAMNAAIEKALTR